MRPRPARWASAATMAPWGRFGAALRTSLVEPRTFAQRTRLRTAGRLRCGISGAVSRHWISVIVHSLSVNLFLV
ncbi:hypothetical protein [uncultured Pseudoramibacter sp.]|uniref:hypothetical protein n=1 Tax=uncultured Pseudoramibacter sp. TaxID=1623493 RepID=UPI0025D93341|nr:hypothetical protein [uncultured Pseudoramibacter sp.]